MPEPAEDNRVRVLRSTELLDSPPERTFDRLSRLEGESPSEVIARADARLYEAKRTGRNRVVG